YFCPVALATKTHRISCREPRTSPTLGPVLHVNPPTRKGSRACAFAEPKGAARNAHTIARTPMLDIAAPANKPRRVNAEMYSKVKPRAVCRCRPQSIRMMVYSRERQNGTLERRPAI